MATVPNALTAGGIADIVATTLKDLGKPRFTEIATDIQHFTAMRNLLKKNRVLFESGYAFQWDVMVNDNGSAANVGLAAEDNVNIVDGMTQATADWRYTTCNYGIIGQTIAMNREPARIVDYVKTRRIMALISLVKLMEVNFWGPPPAVNDVLTPWGVNTWIVKASTQGFNGGVPSGYSTVGLNPTTFPRWQNWTDLYVAVSVDDFVRRARKMATFIDWTPPVDGIPSFNTGDEYGYYANYGVIQPLEELLVSQNDNLGHDVASQDGKLLFRRTPVMWIPQLEADTTNPFYAINWGVFKTAILQDWWLLETHIPNYPGQHTISAHFMDLAYQFIARNKRNHGVLATGTSYPS